MNDRALVKAFLETGSEQHFRTLYHAHATVVYRIALRMCRGNTIEAEELVQEMWIVAIRKLSAFEWKSQFRTWLVAIIMNMARQRFRQQELEVEITVGDARCARDNASIMDLEKAIAALPLGYRQVLILHDIEGYKHHEIAGILQVTEGTSKSQLFHARRLMRKYLTS